MDARTLLLPASIVIAGGLVGAGLFFGLRARAPEGRPSGVTVEVASTGAASADPARASASIPGTPTVGRPHAQATVERAAADVLSRERPRLIKECWAPSARKSAEPASMVVRIRVLFDATGKQLDLSVADATDPRRLDVTDCVRRSGVVVPLDPPGSMTAAQLAITLP